MEFGLNQKEVEEIKNVLACSGEVESALVFGSRSMGSNKKGSDVDLALKGCITFSVVARVKSGLEEETLLPYFFDVLDYGSITNNGLKKHIDEYGELIYSRRK